MPPVARVALLLIILFSLMMTSFSCPTVAAAAPLPFLVGNYSSGKDNVDDEVHQKLSAIKEVIVEGANRQEHIIK